MMIARGLAFGFCLVFPLLFSGCQKGNGVLVQGTVSVKGELVDSGMIQFVPVDGGTAEAGGTIQKGKFAVTVPPGEKIVRIRGYRVQGKKKISGSTPGSTAEIDDEVELTSPKEHWEPSQLRENITAETRKLEFNL